MRKICKNCERYRAKSKDPIYVNCRDAGVRGKWTACDIFIAKQKPVKFLIKKIFMETITITKTENWYMTTSNIYRVEGYGSTPKKALRRYMRKRRKLIKYLKRCGSDYIPQWI